MRREPNVPDIAIGLIGSRLAALRRKAKIGLAGIPLDDTYAVAATDQPPDGVLVPDDETGIVTIDTGNTPAAAGGVAVVLNDMFSLFEKKKPAKKAAKRKDTKVAKSQDETLVLPGANADVDPESSFMEDLFIPVEPEKKKKKKKKKSVLKILNPFD